jgi:hypothetical protein
MFTTGPCSRYMTVRPSAVIGKARHKTKMKKNNNKGHRQSTHAAMEPEPEPQIQTGDMVELHSLSAEILVG